MPGPSASSGSPALQAIPYIRMSLSVAILTIILKFLAWKLSGSVSLLSDALESFVNLAGAAFALLMLHIAATPADTDHPWGHNKAEYFSSGFEGSLIFVAALSILWAAIPRLIRPTPLSHLDLGLFFSVLSTVLNLITARILDKAGRRLHSVSLQADSAHLMTDVWTSIGVIAGLAGFMITGFLWLDALIAILVAIHILREGFKLMRGAIDGLMDQAMDPLDIVLMTNILDSYARHDVSYANLRTRRAGTNCFAHVNILVPGDWSVEKAHQLLDDIETRVAREIHQTQMTTHLEPVYCVVRHASKNACRSRQE